MKNSCYQILGKSRSALSNLTHTDFKTANSRKLIVLTHNLEQGELYDNINRQILHNLKKFELTKINKNVFENNLKELFIRLNWQIFSMFSEENTLDRGISLIFVLIDNNDVLVIQYGRLLCGFKKKKNFIQIGSGWDNFKVKIREGLNLLGSMDSEIPVKILYPEIEIGDIFFCLPSTIIEELNRDDLIDDPVENPQELYSRTSFPYFIFRKEAVATGTKNFFKRIFLRK